MAQHVSEEKLDELRTKLSKYSGPDASIVVFGSLARKEMTRFSDLDWILLLDGVASPEHLETAHAIAKSLASEKAPGAQGTFGTVVSSHDLINHIGGQEDTNANTTRRILLLLESVAIGNSDAYDRVIKNILKRYLNEDYGLRGGYKQHQVPRFLLNDITRYWRMMAVDFAYKQRARNNTGFALRNIKLRLSRKLIYLAGLIACFQCHLGLGETELRRAVEDDDTFLTPVFIERLRGQLALPPLELLAKTLLDFPKLNPSSKKIFDAYEKFLELLHSDVEVQPGCTRRMHLDLLNIDDLRQDDTFQYGRKLSYEFQEGIKEIFLDSANTLGELTLEYGIF